MAPRTDPSIDAAVVALAERQHGVVARRQAERLGMTRTVWLARTAGPGWERLGDRVARRRGSVDDEAQRAMAAVLDAGPGAYLSHASAAAWWGVPGDRLEPIQVINARRPVRSALATVHLPRHLPDPFAAVLAGVPVVRPSLLLLQMAIDMHPEQLRRRLDWMWSRRLLSGPSLRAELTPIMGRGRPGSAAIRALLDSLPAGYVPAASGLESRFDQIVRDHGLPPMRRQVDLGDDERWCGRVDFLAEDVPLVVEVQSDLYHRALSSELDDRRRRARLEGAGFVVVEVDERDVWHRAGEVARRVRAGHWQARRRGTARPGPAA